MINTVIAYKPENYLSDNYLVVDFETTNLSKGSALEADNRIVDAVWYLNRTKKLKATRGNEAQQNKLVADLKTVDFVVAHNAKFELQWLQRCWVDLLDVLPYCTMIGERVLAGNIDKPLSLAETLGRYGLASKLDSVSNMIKAGWNCDDIPSNMLRFYCAVDVLQTQKLFERQKQKLVELNLLPVQFTRCLTTSALADIETKGVYLDVSRVRTEYNLQTLRRGEAERALQEYCGGINWASGKQVAEVLYDQLGFSELTDRRGNPDRTSKGKRRTNKETIAALKPNNKRQAQFLELKKTFSAADAALNKTLKPFHLCAESEEPVIRFQFHQVRVATHRLSSTGSKYGVQGQNMPRAYKRLITARTEGWHIAEADGSQLEFRIAAHLGKDKVAVDDIVNKMDIHSVTASHIFGKDWAAVQDDPEKRDLMRTKAKGHTFRPTFGGEGQTENEKNYVKYFNTRYNALATTQESWVNTVCREKKLVTQSGLIFYFPDVAVDKRGKVNCKTDIYNYPIQSLATAEIIPVAVISLWRRMLQAKLKSFIINTVHDSVIMEVHPDEVDIIREMVKLAFIDDVGSYLLAVYGITLGVPLAAELKIGTHWGDKSVGKWELQ